MKLPPPQYYGYRRVYWRLKLNRGGGGMQTTEAAVRRALCRYAETDFRLMKQSQFLTELYCHTYLKIKSEISSLSEFWTYVSKAHLEFSQLATEALAFLW
jgi:hypothetical protein